MWKKAALLAVVAMLSLEASAYEPVSMKIPAPELQGVTEWINSEPLQLKDQRGKVVVLHFWAFGCINCIHNYPSYAAWKKDFDGKKVVMIGVHTPETAEEKKIDKLKQKVKSNGMDYPIAVDNDAKVWRDWDNRYWPCVYLIDKKGFVRYRWDGELNWKDAKGEAIMRKKIEDLLAE